MPLVSFCWEEGKAFISFSPGWEDGPPRTTDLPLLSQCESAGQWEDWCSGWAPFRNLLRDAWLQNLVGFWTLKDKQLSICWPQCEVLTVIPGLEKNSSPFVTAVPWINCTIATLNHCGLFSRGSSWATEVGCAQLRQLFPLKPEDKVSQKNKVSGPPPCVQDFIMNTSDHFLDTYKHSPVANSSSFSFLLAREAQQQTSATPNRVGNGVLLARKPGLDSLVRQIEESPLFNRLLLLPVFPS